MYAAPIYFSFDLVDDKGDKKDDARRQRWVPLVVVLCVAALAVVLQGIIYLTDYSIDTSLREPTGIREKAAVPLATDSKNDQVTSVELLKVSALTL